MNTSFFFLILSTRYCPITTCSRISGLLVVSGFLSFSISSLILAITRVVGVAIWAWLHEREKCRRVFYLTTPSLIKMAAISRMPLSIISRSVQFLLGSRRSLSFKRHEIHSLLVSNHYRRGLQLYCTRRKSSNANKRTVLYMTAIAVGVAGLSYAAVPLYRLYCQASGYGGTVSKVESGEKIEKMNPVKEREITVRY